MKFVATDRHVSIKSDMKRIYPDVDHQFDVWHSAKSVTKKLTEKAKKKDCSDLLAMCSLTLDFFLYMYTKPKFFSFLVLCSGKCYFHLTFKTNCCQV